MLAPYDKTNFQTLLRAVSDGAAALVEVQRVEDGKPVAAICAIGYEDGEYTITPFAVMVEGNPFELFNPPNPDGGFYTQEQVSE